MPLCCSAVGPENITISVKFLNKIFDQISLAFFIGYQFLTFLYELNLEIFEQVVGQIL